MAVATSIKLDFSSDIRLVDLVHEVAQRAAEVAGFVPDEALNVGLAVREAVINAIVHGNDQQAARSVHMSIEVHDDERLLVRIRDEGGGFDPTGSPDPTAPEHILNASGRGLLMIRAFVDDVDFSYVDGSGMEITLTKRLRPEKRAV